MSKLADMYEKKYPGVDITEAHKEERMQRELFKAEARSGWRTNRNRGIIVPPSSAFDENGRLRP